MSLLFLPIKVEDKSIEQPIFNNLDEMYVEPKFGSTPFFLLYNTENGEKEFIRNTNHHFGGRDTPWGMAKNNKADVIISSHMGSKPYKMFTSENFPILKVNRDDSFSQIIKLYKEGKLADMQVPEHGTSCGDPLKH